MPFVFVSSVFRTATESNCGPFFLLARLLAFFAPSAVVCEEIAPPGYTDVLAIVAVPRIPGICELRRIVVCSHRLALFF